MDFREIEYALRVAEHLGFERAARTLGVSQSAVSRRVSHLEDELGVTLFERNSSGVRITPTGQRVLHRLQSFLSEAADVRSFARANSESKLGTLAIGFYQELSTGLLREILVSHRLQYPEVMVRFFEEVPVAQLIALRERRIDIAFLLSAENAPGVESEELWSQPLFIAVPEHHALAAQAGVTWAALRQERFIVRQHESGPMVYAWLASRLGVEGYAPNIEQNAVSRSSLFGLVACGYGLAPCTSSATGMTYPGVRFVPVVGERSTAPVRVAWLADSFNPALQRFLRHTRDVVQAQRVACP